MRSPDGCAGRRKPRQEPLSYHEHCRLQKHTGSRVCMHPVHFSLARQVNGRPPPVMFADACTCRRPALSQRAGLPFAPVSYCVLEKGWRLPACVSVGPVWMTDVSLRYTASGSGQTPAGRHAGQTERVDGLPSHGSTRIGAESNDEKNNVRTVKCVSDLAVHPGRPAKRGRIIAHMHRIFQIQKHHLQIRMNCK